MPLCARRVIAFSLVLLCAPGAEAADSLPTSAPASLEATDPRIQQIRDLREGTLATSVDPASLFPIRLDDEAALQVEAERTRLFLRSIPDEQPRKGARKKTPPKAPPVDAATWNARLELDRARLDFYTLPEGARRELLQTHAQKIRSSRAESEEAARAQELEQEKLRALEDAKRARSLAEQLVAKERAALADLEQRLNARKKEISVQREKIAQRRDIVLGWKHRASEAKQAAPKADATYDGLRQALRSARDELASTLVTGPHHEPLMLGSDPLADLPQDIAADGVRAERRRVEGLVRATIDDEVLVHEEQAFALLDEIHSLNVERLALLDHLSETKRNAITGFTAEGLDQAHSEARHLSLILRSHLHVASSWRSALSNDGPRSVSSFAIARVVLSWLVAAAGFFWLRRKLPGVLDALTLRAQATDRAERKTKDSHTTRALWLLRQTKDPLGRLAFVAVTLWLFPPSVAGLLEVQLLFSVVGWSLVGTLVVALVDALAAPRRTIFTPAAEIALGEVRLRSLKLVGHTIIAFALLLMVTSRLVGQGTIYGWVLSTCWFAAIPVFLVLVRWWRERVFERLERVRKKTPAQAWVLANRSGWRSFLAAMVGALMVFSTGTVKLAVGWVASFDLTRRIHAYLFKRDIERKDGEKRSVELGPLPDSARQALHPEERPNKWIGSVNQGILEALMRHAESSKGGLTATIGARGMGKSALLDALAEKLSDRAITIRCTGRLEIGALLEHLDRDLGDKSCVILDDAHTLLRPCIGGLDAFDALLAFARAHATKATWVFALDSSLWPLLKRARDARPIFDEIHELEPWNESQIGALLAERNERAQITSSFEDLLDDLPPGADDIDRQEALQNKRAGYERMLWDHVSGNPGLALEAWRASLGVNQAGSVRVRRLRVADVTRLVTLPDSSLFVMRAVLQLAPTNVEAVADATRLRREEVLQDLQYGMNAGFFEQTKEGVRVTWTWLRPITLALGRRHLLVND